MKIVLFNKQEKAGGGIGVVTQRLKKFLLGKGHQVFEIRYSNEPASREFLKVPYVLAEKNMFIFLPHPKTKQIIKDYLTEIKPDLVYLPIGSSFFDLYMPRMCKKLGIRLVGVCHTDISRGSRLSEFVTKWPFEFYLPVCKSVDLLQVFTSELRDFYIKRGVKPAKIVVISNWVDEKKYAPGRSKFKSQKKIDKAVLFVGRITWIKNPELLIKSFLEVADKKTKLIFMGKGDLLAKLKKKYTDKRIMFLGQVNDEEKKIDIIRGCDVFILPSSYEGMSLSLLEAMSVGLACVTTDVASHKEVLDGAGRVISYKNLKKELPQTLIKLINDKKLAKNLGIKARKRILRYYSESAVLGQINREFGKLVN